MAGDAAGELDRFRRQWQEEVKSRSKGRTSVSLNQTVSHEQKSGEAGLSRSSPAPPKTQKDTRESHDNWEYGYHDLEDKDEVRKLGQPGSGTHPSPRREPTSALEHYERAVERETEGSLGDSLTHYRKAYRMDATVDNAYKKKHFPNPPPSIQNPTSPNPSNAPVTVPNPAHHSLTDARGPVRELISSFASTPILREDRPTESSPLPPCPISSIPSETLVQILLQTALRDPASFARLSLVCKRLAYLVATEDRIWRRICLGSEHGFAAMHYTWVCSIVGHALPISIDDLDSPLSSLTLSPSPSSPQDSLPLTPTYPTYKTMYHTRPRLRFAGCYISTVNYIRPGAASASQATWNSPVLVVTYYRYLRFFHDGSCISLLTTAEPVDVVHHLLKENMGKTQAAGLPSAVMNHALRGRWRLSGDPWGGKEARKRARRAKEGEVGDVGGGVITGEVPRGDKTSLGKPEEKEEGNDEEEEEEEEEGTLHIETEGADAGAKTPKYVYKMMLQLQNAGSGANKAGKTRNNKLSWLGYWSYNKLSDDWAEFGLKNDKPFFWSRVRSYGDGAG